ncbi:MAG: outer membrane lipoprotein chaperone LolA [Pseudomonadales bacterium]|nr:outer membrane lipoprotein chaperone LolA [Pseudomonadales bacterium]
MNFLSALSKGIVQPIVQPIVRAGKLFVLSALLVSSHSFAALPAGSVVAELSSLLGLNHTFSAYFEQSVYNHRGRGIQESHGRIWVERPGRFRWQATEPFPQTVVSNGDKLWFYDPDLEQVTIRKFDNQLAATPGLLLSGEVEQLDQSFVVINGAVMPQIKGVKRYILTPRNADSLFAELELVFKERQLVAMQIRDGLGQLTEFRFSDVTVNQPIDSAQFQFVVPEGVDVIQQ